MEFENCEIQFCQMWNSWETIKSWLEKLGASQVIHAIKPYFVLLGQVIPMDMLREKHYE